MEAWSTLSLIIYCCNEQQLMNSSYGKITKSWNSKKQWSKTPHDELKVVLIEICKPATSATPWVRISSKHYRKCVLKAVECLECVVEIWQWSKWRYDVTWPLTMIWCSLCSPTASTVYSCPSCICANSSISKEQHSNESLAGILNGVSIYNITVPMQKCELKAW